MEGAALDLEPATVGTEAAIELLQMQVEAQARQFADLQDRALTAFDSVCARLRALEDARGREVLLLAAIGEQQATSQALLDALLRMNGDLRSAEHRVAALEALVGTVWRAMSAERRPAFRREVQALAQRIETEPAYRAAPETRSILELYIAPTDGRATPVN